MKDISTCPINIELTTSVDINQTRACISRYKSAKCFVILFSFSNRAIGENWVFDGLKLVEDMHYADPDLM